MEITPEDCAGLCDYYQSYLRYKDRIPANLMPGLLRYVTHHECPGDFLQAFLRGDLFSAVFRADDDSLTAFLPLARFLYNEFPGDSFGSREKFKAWIAKDR